MPDVEIDMLQGAEAAGIGFRHAGYGYGWLHEDRFGLEIFSGRPNVGAPPAKSMRLLTFPDRVSA
jgi:hypothetical protein